MRISGAGFGLTISIFSSALSGPIQKTFNVPRPSFFTPLTNNIMHFLLLLLLFLARAGKQLVRQNVLISATLNAKVKALAKLSLSDPVTVSLDDKKLKCVGVFCVCARSCVYFL